MLTHSTYFDGKVQSIGFERNGRKLTAGVIAPGEYHFGTGAPEKMEIVAGACRVKLDGAESWQSYGAGAFFRVPGKSGFSIAVEGELAEYVCSYE